MRALQPQTACLAGRARSGMRGGVRLQRTGTAYCAATRPRRTLLLGQEGATLTGRQRGGNALLTSSQQTNVTWSRARSVASNLAQKSDRSPFQLCDAWLLHWKVTAVFQHHQFFVALDTVKELPARFKARPAIIPRVCQQERTVIKVLGLNVRPHGEN